MKFWLGDEAENTTHSQKYRKKSNKSYKLICGLSFFFRLADVKSKLFDVEGV